MNQRLEAARLLHKLLNSNTHYLILLYTVVLVNVFSWSFRTTEGEQLVRSPRLALQPCADGQPYQTEMQRRRWKVGCRTLVSQGGSPGGRP